MTPKTDHIRILFCLILRFIWSISLFDQLSSSFVSSSYGKHYNKNKQIVPLPYLYSFSLSQIDLSDSCWCLQPLPNFHKRSFCPLLVVDSEKQAANQPAKICSSSLSIFTRINLKPSSLKKKLHRSVTQRGCLVVFEQSARLQYLEVFFSRHRSPFYIVWPNVLIRI